MNAHPRLGFANTYASTPFRYAVRVLCAAVLVACGGGASAPGQPADQSTEGQYAGLMPPASPSQSAMLGVNLPAISDYSLTPVYVDLVHQARQFGPVDAPWGGLGVPVGPDGWPSTDFAVFLMSAKGAFAGTYQGSFTGQAHLSLMASYDTVLTHVRYDARSNQTTFELVRGHSPEVENMVLVLSQTRRNAASPLGSSIAQLQLIRPGYDPAHPPLFTTEFLNHIARFKTLRFMDWLHTNNSAVTTWASRATPATPHASSAGVPWEHIVALANQGRQDIWINVPVYADDDYVRQLATLLQTSLNAQSRIYVEYSNELWNPGFWQFDANKALAQAEVAAAAAAGGASALVFDGNTDPNVWLYRRIAKRGVEISTIFRSVFGDAAMMQRVRPVFASQAVQPYVSRLGLDFVAAAYGPPSRYFYALAIADYFGLGDAAQTDGLSVDQVLQAMRQSVAAMPAQAWFETNQALARSYQLALLAYEGGSDTFGSQNIAAKKAASLNPGMRDLCLRHLANWHQAGGGLFMWYSAGAGSWDTPYGTWELTPDLAMTDSPKDQCLNTWLASTPAPVQHRNSVPGTFSALAYLDNPGPPFAPQSETPVRYQHPGSAPIDYLVFAATGGDYALVLRTGTQVSGNSVDIGLNGAWLERAFELRATPGFDLPLDNAAVPIRLKAGFNVLRIATHTEAANSGAGAGGYKPATLTIR